MDNQSLLDDRLEESTGVNFCVLPCHLIGSGLYALVAIAKNTPVEKTPFV